MVKRKVNNFFIIIFILLVLINTSESQVSSPFNKLILQDTPSVYSFIISGHFHGASTNASTFPSSTIQASIDTLNSLNPLFLMSLGDMFIDVNETYIHHYQKSLFDKLKMPLFNAVGNHDVSNGNMYEKLFGKSYFSFRNGTEVFIILDTEKDDGSVMADQLAFLTDALKLSFSKNIFIFSHRPVWAENSERYKKLFNGNTRTMFGSNNYENVVRPLLMKYSKEKNIYWVSGSLGGGPASFFYDKEIATNITFMQTAIRDQQRDAVLRVNVADGIVNFNGISLTGEQLEPIENYNVDFWNNTIPVEQKFNFRLLPYLTKQLIFHHYFWVGFISSVILIAFFVLIKNRWKRSK